MLETDHIKKSFELQPLLLDVTENFDGFLGTCRLASNLCDSSFGLFKTAVETGQRLPYEDLHDLIIEA